MYVKDHMTKEPVTITKDTKISKAVDIMSKGHFHRLPIVDESGRLIGLVTGGLVTEKSGANATSLSIYELNYLLSKTKVEDIMLTDVKTINQDAFIEEAAQKMLDEPSMGLSPLLVSEIFQIIEEINKKGTTILLVEQNAKRALSIANRAYVLETGRITLEGTGEGLARDERVRKAYLGG